MAEYVLVDEMVKRARELYNTAPYPETMQIILGSMYETLQQVAEVRGDLGDLTSGTFWEGVLAALVEEGTLPEKLSEVANDRAQAMQDWDARAAQFWLRFDEYGKIADLAAGGYNTAGQYIANVVQPVLYGHAYASPGQQIWSHAEFPDVITPFRLWNELTQYLEGTDLLARLEGWTTRVIQKFAQAVKDKATEAASKLGEAAVAPLIEWADETIADADEQLTEEKEAARKEIETGVLVGVGVAVVAALGAAWVFTRKRKRR